MNHVCFRALVAFAFSCAHTPAVSTLAAPLLLAAPPPPPHRRPAPTKMIAPSSSSSSPTAAAPQASPAPPRAPSVLLERAACTYTPCYCEENALLLSKHLVRSGVVCSAESLYVVFVTNRRRQVRVYGGTVARLGLQSGECFCSCLGPMNMCAQQQASEQASFKKRSSRHPQHPHFLSST